MGLRAATLTQFEVFEVWLTEVSRFGAEAQESGARGNAATTGRGEPSERWLQWLSVVVDVAVQRMLGSCHDVDASETRGVE